MLVKLQWISFIKTWRNSRADEKLSGGPSSYFTTYWMWRPTTHICSWRRMTRKSFLKDLSFQLTKSHARFRHARNRSLPKLVQEVVYLLGLRQKSVREPQQADNSIRHCKECQKSTRSKCDECSAPIYSAHRIIVKKWKCEYCWSLLFSLYQRSVNIFSVLYDHTSVCPATSRSLTIQQHM